MRFCFYKYGIVLIVSYAAVLSGCSAGYDTTTGCYSTSQFQRISVPSFSVYVMNVKTEKESRIDLYLQMPYRHLRFEKLENGYKASYSITFLVRNTDNEIIQSKELERFVVVKTYEETVSSRFDAALQTFVLQPGKYPIESISNDHLSQLRYRQVSFVEAKDFSIGTVMASSLLLLDTVTNDSKGVALRPIFPASLSLLNGSFGIFQELYNITAGDVITISESFSKRKHSRTSDASFVYTVPPYRMNSEGCSEVLDSIYYRVDSSFVAQKSGTQQMIQFFLLPSGGYTKVDRSIIVSQHSRSDTLRFSDNYFLRDHTLQSSLSLQEITAAMRYVLREEEYEAIDSASGQEKNKRLNQFWESRGGVGKRKEFEQRIREANTLFTTCMNGSETPMGIVYIVCGAPDYIECTGGAIETWFYNFGEKSFSMQFRQERENIPYFVLEPYSVNDSLWQYYVDRWRRKK